MAFLSVVIFSPDPACGQFISVIASNYRFNQGKYNGRGPIKKINLTSRARVCSVVVLSFCALLVVCRQALKQENYELEHSRLGYQMRILEILKNTLV